MLDDHDILVEVVVRPRHAYVRLPDMRVIERPGWFQLVTPSFREGGFNEVHATLDEADADRVIAETIAEYAALGIKFRWTVGPHSAPADLAARLARAGLRRTDALGMVLPVPCEIEVPPPRAGVEVVRVDASNVDDFNLVESAGWGRDPAPFRVANEVMLASPAQHMYLALVDGEPAATAKGVQFERSMYLMGGVVRDSFRGRGVYRALVEARVVDASRLGLEVVTAHALVDTSAPMLAHLGFTTACSFASFRN